MKKQTINVFSIALGSAAFISSAHAIDFKISGQVSRMIVAPDDATGDDFQHQDIGWSGSRFRITGEEVLDSGLSLIHISEPTRPY